MQKYYYILFCFTILFLPGTSFSQEQTTSLDTSSLNQEKTKNENFLLDKYLQKNLAIFDTLNISKDDFTVLLDTLKYIFELKQFTKMVLKEVPGLDITKQIIQHNKRRDLILLTSKEYFKNQPNYSLGVVGEYLGMTKTMTAIILAIISL